MYRAPPAGQTPLGSRPDDVALLVMAELLGNQCQTSVLHPLLSVPIQPRLGAALDALLVAMMTFWRIGLMNHNLAHAAQPVASWLRRNAVEAAPRVGILASRSLATYTGILGTCWAGGTYVPISTKLPESRLIQLLKRVQAEALIVDSANVTALSKRVLSYCPRLILAPDLATSSVMLADNGKSVAGMFGQVIGGNAVTINTFSPGQIAVDSANNIYTAGGSLAQANSILIFNYCQSEVGV
jgi:non-ribosomal peptide synthetase component F